MGGGDQPDLKFSGDEQARPSQDSKRAFTQVKSMRQHGGVSIESKFSQTQFLNIEACVGNQIPQSLHVPREQMMIRLGGIEGSIATFLFKRDVEQQFSSGFKQALQFTEGREGIRDMFQGMMTKDDVNARLGQGFGVWKELDSAMTNVIRQKFGDVTADFSGAREAGEIPT